MDQESKCHCKEESTCTQTKSCCTCGNEALNCPGFQFENLQLFLFEIRSRLRLHQSGQRMCLWKFVQM